MSFPKFLEIPDIGALQKIDEILAQKKLSRFQIKLMIYFALMSCIVSAIVIFLICRASTNSLSDELKTQLRRLSKSVALDFNGEAHKKLVSEWDELQQMLKNKAPQAEIDSKKHKIKVLHEIMQTKLKRYFDMYNFEDSTKILYIYTMFRKQNSTEILLGISADEPHIFENFEFNKAYSIKGIDEVELIALKQAFLGKPGTDEHLVADQNETTLSGYAPIYDNNNKIVAIIGIDIDAKEISAAFSNVIFWSVFALIISSVLSLTLTFYLSNQITRPIKSLIKATKEIGEGNFDYEIKVKNCNEIGDLAQSMNLMSRGLKERVWIKNMIKRYVSEQVAQKILEKPEQIKLQAERSWSTLMFTDIQGFTSIAEKNEPEHVFTMLNEYLGCMIEIIFKHEGALDKFKGDGLMAIFGAPYKIDFASEKAVKCALEMQKRVAILRKIWIERDWFPIEIRIGINTGFVVAGNIGSEKRSEFTVIGDAVNLASRLERKNKELETSTLISASTYNDIELERKKHIASAKNTDSDLVVSTSAPEEVCNFEIVGEFYVNVKDKQDQIKVYAIT